MNVGQAELIDRLKSSDAHMPLVDGCGRTIDHLRLSVTSRCDMRCFYCRPVGEYEEPAKEASISDSDRVAFIQFLAEAYGLSHVRITGGEPLLYGGVVGLVEEIRRRVPQVSIAMTTNAVRLHECAKPLRDAGLDRLNVSLDSLDAVRFEKITGVPLDSVLRGISAAEQAGFPPPKLNTVVLRGVNDDELAALAIWGMSRGSEVRFLEAMPIGPAAGANQRGFVSAAEIRAILKKQLTLEALDFQSGATARRYVARNAQVEGIIGLISPVTENFCGSCRRIRLTADGLLYPCLLDDRSTDMRPAWADGALDEVRADRLLRSAVGDKAAQGVRQHAPMITLGG